MKITYVPLLQIQRDLHDLPRGMERFRKYLKTMVNEDGTDLSLVPLVIANPMAKDHVKTLLDTLLELDADGQAARAVEQASDPLADVPGEFQAALVLADDAKGGWTNRYSYEHDLRFGPDHLRSRTGSRLVNRQWIIGVLWGSDSPTKVSAQEAILTSVYRQAYITRNGPAQTLRRMLAQEGTAMAMAGCTSPILDEADLAYTRDVIGPHLEENGVRITVECLFGDTAAQSLGFTPRGLTHLAGLALALHDAKENMAVSVQQSAKRNDLNSERC